MKNWEEIILEAKDKNKENAERQRRLKIAKTALKASSILNKGKKKKEDKKDSRYLDYLERRQETREKEIEKQRKQEEENKKNKLVAQKEKKLAASKEKIRSSLKNIKTQEIDSKEGGATATAKSIGNLGSLVGGITKAAINVPGYIKAKKDRDEATKATIKSKQPEKPRERKKPGRPPSPSVPSASSPETSTSTPKQLPPATKKLPPSGGTSFGRRPKAKTLGQRARQNPKIRAGLIQQRMSEEHSNWREEFLFEIDELKGGKGSNAKRKNNVIDVMTGTNSEVIEINPNISEDHKEIASGKKKDDEGYMANVELDQMERAIKALRKKVKKADTQLPAWVQSKITRAADYIDTASEYLQSDENISEGIDKDKMKCNKPKAQAHGSGETGKSHIVKACEGGKEKIIRFGQLGVKGSPKKEGESKAYASRRHRFKTRHAKNIAKGKMSAAYWANKVKW